MPVSMAESSSLSPIMVDNLKKRIEKTGCTEGESNITHLALSQDEFDLLPRGRSLEDFAFDIGVDVISVKRNGTVNFLRVDDYISLDYIRNNGITSRPKFKSDWVHDLGRGIYAIDPTAWNNGMENLQNYVLDDSEGAEGIILVIEGVYTGEYLDCVYGDNHEGYIVLLTEHIPREQLTVYQENISEFMRRS